MVHNILKWISGTKTVPLLGFQERLSIAFVHGCPDNCRCHPTASLCDLSMKVSVLINSFNEMFEMMTTGNVGEFPTYSNWGNPGTKLGQTWV